MSEPLNLSDADMTTDGPDDPTEGNEDLDQPGEGERDTGDEPTEADEDLDQPGEGERDSGDH